MKQKLNRLTLVANSTACKPVQRVAPLALREATTGRLVQIVPRIWAVAETKPTPKTVGPAGFAGTNQVDPLLGAHRSRPEPELAFYRKYTEHMLRRYHYLSLAGGRVPSLVGREVFSNSITSYTVQNFEEAIVFCVDVEKCLARLEPIERAVLKRIVIQGYTHEEAAPMFGVSLCTCKRRYYQAVDTLTIILLETRMLEPFKSCQGGQEAAVGARD